MVAGAVFWGFYPVKLFFLAGELFAKSCSGPLTEGAHVEHLKHAFCESQKPDHEQNQHSCLIAVT